LIARVADAQDKRRVLLSLTAKGAQALNHLAAQHLAQMDEARDSIMRGLGLEPGQN
jgi:DNA-binding MarR family transcriptional regulator